MAALLSVAVGVSWAAPAGAQAATSGQPTVVVAVADTGVNPYHEMYYRPENTAHPCTWVAGFDDCSIPALELSIGEYATYEEAVAADRAVWDAVKLHQWYWIPRTNIIGAVCEGTGSISTSVGVCILDDNGHGTGTTSSVLTEEPDALLLVHEGNSGAYDLATAPVVPDLQSHSWAPPAPLPLHAADPLVPGGSVFCGDRAFDVETILFLAAGNEAPFPTFLDCSRVDNRVQVVGGGYPGYWTPVSWSAYDFASWFCRPTALHTSTTDMRDSYCGTSFSAPTAAGTAAAALLAIRRAEGYGGRSTADMVSASVSREAFIGALRSAATYTPDSKFDNTPDVFSPGIPLPEQAPYLFWGYGWLDSTVAAAVTACALDGDCPAKSDEAATYNEQRRAIRSATFDDVVPPAPQNDAGSGRDAGATVRTAVPVEAGQVYDARLEAYFNGPDEQDLFTFEAGAGQSLSLNVAGAVACWDVTDPAGESLAGGCVTPGSSEGFRDVPTTVAGTYVLSYHYFAPPQDYRFSIGLDAPAPPL